MPREQVPRKSSLDDFLDDDDDIDSALDDDEVLRPKVQSYTRNLRPESASTTSSRGARPGSAGSRGGIGRPGRSPSPNPLESKQSMTSIGPGLSGIGKPARSQSPSPLQNKQSMTSIGPGLGGLGKQGRAPSPSPLENTQSMTSIGPGLEGIAKGSESKRRPVSRSPRDDQAGSLEAGPSGLASLRQQATGSSALQPPQSQPASQRHPSPASNRVRQGGASLEAGPGGLGSFRRDVHEAAEAPMPPRSDLDSSPRPPTTYHPPSPATLHQPPDLGIRNDGKEKKHKKDKKQKKEKARHGSPKAGEIDSSFSKSHYPQASLENQRGRAPSPAPQMGPPTDIRPPSPAPLRGVQSPGQRAPSLEPETHRGGRAPSHDPEIQRHGRTGESRPASQESTRSESRSQQKGKKTKRDAPDIADESTTVESKPATDEKRDKKVKKGKKDKNSIGKNVLQGSVDSIDFSTDVHGGSSVFLSSDKKHSKFRDLDGGDSLDESGSVMLPERDEGGSLDRLHKQWNTIGGELDGGGSVTRSDHIERSSIGALDGGGSVMLPVDESRSDMNDQLAAIFRPAAPEKGMSSLHAVGSTDTGHKVKSAKEAIPNSTSVGLRKEKTPDAQLLRRFFINFDPPMLAAEVTVGTQTIIRQVTAKAALEDREGVNMRSLAERLLRDLMLPARHAEQVEALLRRLAAHALPVYRVIGPKGAELVDAEAPEAGGPRSLVPLGALVLARERRKKPDGWWIRLAAGGGWMRESTAAGEEIAVRCEPHSEEVQQWVKKAAAQSSKNANMLVRNAAAVSYQVGSGQAKKAAAPGRDQRTAGITPSLARAESLEELA